MYQLYQILHIHFHSIFHHIEYQYMYINVVVWNKYLFLNLYILKFFLFRIIGECTQVEKIQHDSAISKSNKISNIYHKKIQIKVMWSALTNAVFNYWSLVKILNIKILSRFDKFEIDHIFGRNVIRWSCCGRFFHSLCWWRFRNRYRSCLLGGLARHGFLRQWTLNGHQGWLCQTSKIQ